MDIMYEYVMITSDFPMNAMSNTKQKRNAFKVFTENIMAWPLIKTIERLQCEDILRQCRIE